MQNPAKRHLQKPPAANKFALTEKRHSGKFRGAVFFYGVRRSCGRERLFWLEVIRSKAMHHPERRWYHQYAPARWTGGSIPAEAPLPAALRR